MANIGIDARFAFGKKRGIGIYSINLIQNILNLDSENSYFLFVDSYIYKSEFIDWKFNIRFVKLPIKFYPIWEQVLLPYYIKKYNIDLFHGLGSTAPLVKLNTYKLITTIHDVFYMKQFNFVKTPYLWQKLGRVYRKIIVPIVAEKSDLIITVSNFAKKDIINEFSLSEDKVKVIYLGTSKIFSNVEFKDRYKNKKIGITITGKDPQKNIINLLESLNVIFKKKLLDEFIVIGIKEDEYKQFIHKNHRSKIKILEFASQECIKTLLLESWVFILASHYESFGIPAVEAMKCSLPVISSNKGALPEITGMESMSFNPNKLSTDLPVKLEKLSDINFYNKIARKSWARGEDFSYESTAKTTLDFYKNILEGI